LSEGSRNFRVSWDGTLYSTNGHFTGEINALSGTLGNLDVAGTLNGGNIYGAYIHGAEIEGGSISSGDAFISDGIISGATLKGSTIYFGQGAGYTYKVYDSKGNLIRTRTYAAPLDELKKGDLTYVLDPDAEIDASEIGVLRDVYGDDGHGTTHGVELAVTNKDYFLRLANEGRILIKSTGAETDSWVALNAGPGWDYSNGGGHVVIQPDGAVYINATKIKFETADAEDQEGIYARFA
jgi:hypothetical protein